MPRIGAGRTEEQCNGKRPVARPVRSQLARTLRAVNVTKNLFAVHQAVFIKLQGTSFHLPGVPAATTMAAGAACIKAAISDLDDAYPTDQGCARQAGDAGGGLEEARACRFPRHRGHQWYEGRYGDGG
eukprot:TRINITY_DN2105_c0_g1_i1.p1 TRINITY_DN2105_c0_g1~~TRINITY_DN2105_c0_g1_i1.p1  ORF type:complete len:128 (-),score=9.64 TRINITY_DN2105_c0_g1_i1:187-570(-)